MDERCQHCGAELESYIRCDHWEWTCGSAFYLPSRTFIQSKECLKLQKASSRKFFVYCDPGQLGLLVKDRRSTVSRFQFPDVDMYITLKEDEDKRKQGTYCSNLHRLSAELGINIVMIVNKMKNEEANCSKEFTYMVDVVAFEKDADLVVIKKDRYGPVDREILV